MAYNIAPSKQDLLVSGTNIKTINSNSILGSGNLTIAGLPTSTNPTDADKVVAVDSSGVASWQYAGLGSGSLGTGNVVLGRSKPTSLSGTANTILGVSAATALTTGSGNIFLGYTAGDAVTTGSNNVIIGDIAGTTTLADTIILAAGTNERIRVDSSGNVGIGTATPSEKLEVSGAILATEVAVANYKLSPKVHDEGTETGNFTINWANSPVQLVTLNGTTNAVVTLNNPVTGGAYAIKIVQGATPGTIDFTAGSFANVKWPGGTPPTLSGTTGDIDLINLLYIGTTYYGTFALDFA